MRNYDVFEDLPMKAEKQICSANILKVNVGTTGFCGGDSGHGGRTCLMFEDLGGTDIRVRIGDEYFERRKFQIWLGGDCELSTFIDALEFAANSLKAMIGE